ncbi:MAG: hypothetical protein ACU0HS_11660 [Paracoccus sp. (in: a-proteobacteria)]|uniref:hypothetical protein n=1 Tax=Paracoccus sp. TaxID=267 RepID=UPI004058BE3D
MPHFLSLIRQRPLQQVWELLSRRRPRKAREERTILNRVPDVQQCPLLNVLEGLNRKGLRIAGNSPATAGGSRPIPSQTSWRRGSMGQSYVSHTLAASILMQGIF